MSNMSIAPLLYISKFEVTFLTLCAFCIGLSFKFAFNSGLEGEAWRIGVICLGTGSGDYCSGDNSYLDCSLAIVGLVGFVIDFLEI